MNRTLIKSLQRAAFFAISLTLSALGVVGCADEGLSEFDLETGLYLESFTVNVVSGADVEVEINNDARIVNIYGVANGASIKSASFTSNIDAVLSPSLESKIGNWASTFTTVLLAENASVTYVVNLLDYDKGDSNVLTVSPSFETKKQEVLMIGTDMERSQGNMINAPNAAEVAQWCFGDIDWKVLRLSYDKKQELEEGTKNFEFYDNCLAALALIKEVRPDIELWATLKSDYNGYDGENNYPDWISDYDLKDLNTEKYATFLVDYLEYFENKGYPMTYMSTSKEYTQVNTAARTQEVIKYMVEMMDERGVTPPKFVDAATWGATQGANYVTSVASLDFEDQYFGFCCHAYDGNTYDAMCANTAALSKTNIHGNDYYYAIQDETGGGTMGAYSGVDAKSTFPVGTYVGKCTMFEAGMQGELIFEIFSRGVASESRAVYCNYSAGTDAVRLSSYYLLKAHGNYFEDGMYYLGSEQTNMVSGISSMQFANYDENGDGIRMYVCVCNNTDVELSTFTLDLGDLEYNGAVERQVMDEYTVKTLGIFEGYTYKESLYGGELTFSVPAMSITFIQLDLTKSAFTGDTGSGDSGDDGDVENTDINLGNLNNGGSAWK